MAEVLVLFDYDAQADDELTIRKGDVIREVKKLEGGWWDGLLGTTRGFFPDNFVVVVTEAEMNISRPTPSGVHQTGEANKVCKALFSYTPCHEDELELKVGDDILFLGEVEEGWWRGKLRGKEGVFPSNFVTAPVAAVVKDPEPVPKPVVIQEPAPELPPKPVKELARVLFPYAATQPDELELKEGEIVTVLSKECEDKGWWKGKLNNKIGLFPDNFVTLLSTSNASNGSFKSDDASFSPATSSGVGHSATPKTRNSIVGTSESAASELSSPRSPVDSKKIADAFIAGLAAQQLATPSISLSDEQKLLRVEKANLSDVITPTEVLAHPTANRPRIVSRRPPSSIFHKEESRNDGPTNGDSTLPKGEQENGVVAVEPQQPQPVTKARTPPVKPPWMEELKRNQEKRAPPGITETIPEKPAAPSKPKPALATGPTNVKPSFVPHPLNKASPEPNHPVKLEHRTSTGKLTTDPLPNGNAVQLDATIKNKPPPPTTSPNAGGGFKPNAAPATDATAGTIFTPLKPVRVPGAGETKEIKTAANGSIAATDLGKTSSGSMDETGLQQEVQGLRVRVSTLEATVRNLQESLQHLTKVLEEERRIRMSKEGNKHDMTLIHI